MCKKKIKVFISYKSGENDFHKHWLIKQISLNNKFIDNSVLYWDIGENYNDKVIMDKIESNHLDGSDLTILICGENTKTRKFINWEIIKTIEDKKPIIIINTVNNNFFGSDDLLKWIKDNAIKDNTIFIKDKKIEKEKLQKEFEFVPEIIFEVLDPIAISIIPFNILINDKDKIRKFFFELETIIGKRNDENANFNKLDDLKRKWNYKNKYVNNIKLIDEN